MCDIWINAEDWHWEFTAEQWFLDSTNTEIKLENLKMHNSSIYKFTEDETKRLSPLQIEYTKATTAPQTQLTPTETSMRNNLLIPSLPESISIIN